MARKWIVIAASVLALVSANLPGARGQQKRVLAVTGGTLIDGTGAAPVPDGVDRHREWQDCERGAARERADSRQGRAWSTPRENS